MKCLCNCSGDVLEAKGWRLKLERRCARLCVADGVDHAKHVCRAQHAVPLRKAKEIPRTADAERPKTGAGEKVDAASLGMTSCG